MTRILLSFALLVPASALAHGEGHVSNHEEVHTDVDRPDGPDLHLGYDYDTCYIDLHEGLTQTDFRQFNREWATTYAFTTTSSQMVGRGHVQIDLALRKTNIDDTEDAWNETWSHPEHDHWLGPVDLPIVQVRVGLSHATQLEAMFSYGMSNWAIGGLGLRHELLRGKRGFDLSVRETIQVTQGGRNWTMVSAGGDVILGTTFELGTRHLTVTPFGSVGGSSAFGVETDEDVDLEPVATFTPRAAAGLALGVGPARVSLEGTASTDTLYATLSVGARF